METPIVKALSPDGTYINFVNITHYTLVHCTIPAIKYLKNAKITEHIHCIQGSIRGTGFDINLSLANLKIIFQVC